VGLKDRLLGGRERVKAARLKRNFLPVMICQGNREELKERGGRK